MQYDESVPYSTALLSSLHFHQITSIVKAIEADEGDATKFCYCFNFLMEIENIIAECTKAVIKQ